MRDIISCFNENAVTVSRSSCSSYSHNACVTPSLIPSVQNVVICLYKVMLSSQKQLYISVTWFKNQPGQGLSMNFGNDPTASYKPNNSSRLFRKKKGSKAIEVDNYRIEVFWDLSTAKYDTGPEPLDGYYILVKVDSQVALLLGDLAEDVFSKKFKKNTSIGKIHLISRQEYCSGNTLYSTKAKFSDKGSVHDILIKCTGENEGLKYPVLSVYVDKNMVIRVKRLHWNFRGNQAIFIDGLLVDLMWNVHDWFYNPASGYAVFMFRTRSGMDSRLWLEEKLIQKEQEGAGFSLLIYACKSP